MPQARQDAWEDTSKGTRAWFTWPTSGAPREPDEGVFNAPVPEGPTPAVPSFALVLVDAQSVDYVLLPGAVASPVCFLGAYMWPWLARGSADMFHALPGGAFVIKIVFM